MKIEKDTKNEKCRGRFSVCGIFAAAARRELPAGRRFDNLLTAVL